MDYKTLIEESNKLFAEAKSLLAAGADAEGLARAQKLADDAKSKRAQATQLKEILDAGIMQAQAEAQPETKEAKQVGKFADWADFLRASHEATRPNSRKVDQRLQYFRDELPGSQKVMTENVGSAGGFLVPVEFQAQLQGVMAEEGIVRRSATKIRMNRRQIQIPVLDQTGTTAGQPHWFGGMKFYWGEEAAEKTNTDAKFRQATLTAWKLYGYTYASDELNDDAFISLSDFLQGPLGFGGGVAWMEDYAFLRGTGAGQPQGIVDAGATITVTRAGAGAISMADIINMYESFLPSARGVWVINQSAMSNIMTVNDGTNYLFIQSASAGVPNTLLGLPIIWTEKLPTIGYKGDILLADFRYYLIGDRQATTVESTKFDRWKYDETSWRVVHRVDGQPWLSAPLTYQDGTIRVSPFVVLSGTASS